MELLGEVRTERRINTRLHLFPNIGRRRIILPKLGLKKRPETYVLYHVVLEDRFLRLSGRIIDS